MEESILVMPVRLVGFLSPGGVNSHFSVCWS